MIIKSTNKTIHGASNANITKGVLSQKKSRVDSSLRKTHSSAHSRAHYV